MRFSKIKCLQNKTSHIEFFYNSLCNIRKFFDLSKICKKCAQQFITAMICTATNIKINPCALKNLVNPLPSSFFTHSLKTLSFISPSITKDRHWVQNKLHLLWILIFNATFFNVIMIFTILQVCVHFHIQYSSSISSLNSRAFIGWQCKH